MTRIRPSTERSETTPATAVEEAAIWITPPCAEMPDVDSAYDPIFDTLSAQASEPLCSELSAFDIGERGRLKQIPDVDCVYDETFDAFRTSPGR